MSLAVLADNGDQVEYLLKYHPSTVDERNLLGQSPLHLAAGKPWCLRLLVEAADDELLNETDVEGLSAFEMALLVGCSRCQNRPRLGLSMNGRCRRCEGEECAGILLNAGCAVPVRKLQHILDNCPSRCRLQYMRAIRDRRDRLKQLALEHLSAAEAGPLGLLSDAGLDFYAPQAIQLLEQRRIGIPEALKIGSPDSIYGQLRHPPHAALLFRLGFHDTSSWLKADPEILRDLPMPYIEWLDNHGFDALSLRLRSSENGNRASTAHFTLYRLGLLLCLPNTILSPEWAQKLQIALLSPGVADICQCRCSTNGCTPLTFLLKGINENPCWETLNPPFGRRSFLNFLDIFGPHLDLRNHLASLRYMTFAALDIPHTCCGVFLGDDCSAEDVEEIQSEHEHELGLLEGLLEELGAQMVEILQNPDRGLDGLNEFWERTWIGRVTKTQQHLDGSDVSDTERQHAEDIGVVWDEAPSPEPSEESRVNWWYYSGGWKYWVAELEKIEAECN